MSADEPDKSKPQTDAPQDADDERTQFIPVPSALTPAPKDEAKEEPPAEDDDRTQFFALPPDAGEPPQDPAGDDDPAPVAQEEDDRTQFITLPSQTSDAPEEKAATASDAAPDTPEPVSPEDDDRTQFITLPSGDDTVEETANAQDPAGASEDRTMFVPMPDTADAGDVAEAPGDPTGNDPEDQPDNDRTQFAPETGAEAAAPDEPAVAADATIPPHATTQPPQSTSQPPQAASEGTQPPGAVERTQIPTETEGSVPPLPQPKTAALVAAAAVGTTGIGIGTLINNNYEIRQVLKSGGMGEVYRGVEIGTGDPVAIKAILPELAEDEKAGLLFKREARTLRQLSDEAIVRYYNYVHDRDLDRYFLVMEFIEGVPLSDHIEQHGAIPAPAAMTLLKRLAKGLSRAHAQDVIHRDLSPDNVMLADGDVTRARLIDFGIAKSNVVKESTMRGQFAGKFKYVAPEQLGHYDGEIGPGTDIYGLALLICAAALGRPLNMGSSIVEAVQSRQSIPNLTGVPAALVPIISHMLEPNPARRPASMDEVRSMLENPGLIPVAYREGLPPPPAIELTGRMPLPTIPPLTTPPPGLQVPTSAFPHGTTTTRTTIPPLDPIPEQRRSAMGPLLVLVFLALIGGGGWYAWQSGMIDAQLGQAGAEDTTPDVAKGIPAPKESTRAGFLARFDTGPCTYTNRIAAGANAGMIEGYSSTGEVFSGLPVSYEEKFGARPAILPREVTVEQCAALDFARALQGRDHPPVTFQMFADEVESEQEISGQIRTGGEQTIWPVLVAPNGGVYNLSGRMSAPVNWQRSLRFGMRLEAGATAVPQLILVVSSDKPLTLTATAQPGALASELLPLLLEEIAERGGAASASLAYVLLTPPL